MQLHHRVHFNCSALSYIHTSISVIRKGQLYRFLWYDVPICRYISHGTRSSHVTQAQASFSSDKGHQTPPRPPREEAASMTMTGSDPVTRQRWWICCGFAFAVIVCALWGSAHQIPRRGAVVLNTWAFTNATRAGFRALQGGGRAHALDAITRGCNRCEVEQCDFTVGYGGSPDSSGETTLDAMILDGSTMDMGAVAQLRRVKPAIEVARAVMEHSAHSILAGDGALDFAKMMGFQEEALETPYSRQIYQQWRDQSCQPNYFRNVVAQNSSCPPYAPLPLAREDESDSVFAGQSGQMLLRTTSDREGHTDVESLISKENHDTIGMVALGSDGHMAAGTSSNGATHKIAGRVGDAAVPGAGAFVDSSIGGAAATGDGDVMMRFLPSFYAVQEMARGLHPQRACEHALHRIAKVHPHFLGAMVCLNRFGEYGGAGYGWDFVYSVQTSGMSEPKVVHVAPMVAVQSDTWREE